MKNTIDISGVWRLQLNGLYKDISFENAASILLPDSIANAQKGEYNNEVNTGFLTPEYKFEGTAWFRSSFDIPEENSQDICKLFLERTRISYLYINGMSAGSQNSFYAPHIYDISQVCRAGENDIVIGVKNTDYLTKGGHMTSPDTQTNWNGILGRMEIQFFDKKHVEFLEIDTDYKNQNVLLRGGLSLSEDSETETTMTVRISELNYPCVSENVSISEDKGMVIHKKKIAVESVITCRNGEIRAKINVPKAKLWDEFEPNVYLLELLVDSEVYQSVFGFREFKAENTKFTINGVPTFLRGKHDGLIFPLTGYAPMTVSEWIRVMSIAKDYGINHYRFHTCCPPEAAFYAADFLGIYMEPELPFWGSVTEEGEENHNQEEQDFLFEEGIRMLKAYGNHPSFVMMSLGNELWGSHEVINSMLLKYKKFDNRHLYVQGSNNFQFCPVVLEGDDFFCGVRFARERLIRGSYAMCDAPLGHIQTDRPSTCKSYDEAIGIENEEKAEPEKAINQAKGTIQIQYETGAKEVKATGYDPDMIPKVPVVSHEIGQYETFPDFREIKKYTGLLKARNFEVFLDNCKKTGQDTIAYDLFLNSGKLAAACYKEELEAAARSEYLAGFQLLDLQDFSGQGTALVGMLDAFMDNKGILSSKEWRQFCDNKMIFAKFSSYTWTEEEEFEAELAASVFLGNKELKGNVEWKASVDNIVIANGSIPTEIHSPGHMSFGMIHFCMPATEAVKKIEFSIQFLESGHEDSVRMENNYILWCYPKNEAFEFKKVYEKENVKLYVTNRMAEAKEHCSQGERVLLLGDDGQKTIAGTYCVDFWCYPMFRTISDMFKKPWPVGTMGLKIENNHPALQYFLSESYTTPQWYDIINATNCAVLDELPKDFFPIVQMIDNFERCHKLGILYELRQETGKILICTAPLDKHQDRKEIRQFMKSLVQYGLSKEYMQ